MKMNLVLASMLISVIAVAEGRDKPASSSSSVVVTNLEGSSLFKLHYQSVKAQNVKISLLDNEGNQIFTETIRKADRFIRPYNFQDMAEGQYTMQIEDEYGVTLEKVNFNRIKIQKWVRISKLTGMENKFSLIVSSAKKDIVTISIFDNSSNLVHSETQEVNGAFAKVFNIKGLESFNIEVSDSNGLVKSVKY